MRKCIAALAVITFAIILAACSRLGGHDAYGEIYKRYNSLKSFRAAAEITVRNDRTENVYSVRQVYAAPDRFAMTVEKPSEIAGCGYVFRGGEVLLKSGLGESERFPDVFSDERSAVLLTDFFEEYYKSEDSYVETLAEKNPAETVMSCFLSEKNKNRFSQTLWIDNRTFLPIRLETYDSDGNMTVRVEYREFERNCDTKESDFE